MAAPEADPYFDDPSCAALRDRWHRLALGVAIHRYFLHTDRALEADTGLDHRSRRALVESGGEERWRALLERFAEPARARPAPPPAGVWSGALGQLATLGAVGVVQRSSPWQRGLGLLDAGLGSEQPRAVRGVFLGFLYAGRRESGDGAPFPALMEELEARHLAIADAVERCAAAGVGAVDRADRELIESGADALGFPPATDLALTLCGSSRVLARYATGLGVGQS